MRNATLPAVVLGALLLGAPAPAAATGTDPNRYAEPGPHPIAVQEVLVTRPDDDGEDFEARLFVPLPAPADATDALAASPLVAFGHGYLSPVELYESTLRHLASWGITAIAPRSGSELLPDHAEFSQDLSAASEWVTTVAAADETWPGLPVDVRVRGVGGHSMGGGAAVLAAASEAGIGAVATLAAADTRPSSIGAAAELAVPALFVAASDDGITPVGAHQRPMFEATSGVPAQLRIIEGGSHCGFLDRAILEGVVCDESAIPIEDQLAFSRAALVAFFRAELAGDAESLDAAWPPGPVEGLAIETKGDSR
jgi:dienelactone hydrolase